MELYSLPNKHKGAGCYAVPSDVRSLLRGLGQPGLVAIEIACSIVFVAMGFEDDRACRSLLLPFWFLYSIAMLVAKDTGIASVVMAMKE